MNRHLNSYPEREQKILEYLGTHEYASVGEIAAVIDASLPTARRDLTLMAGKGSVERTRGYVSRKQAEPQPAYADKAAQILTPVDSEKALVAAEAARLVKAGDVIFIGAGKTCNLFADQIRGTGFLTVYTTSLDAVMQLVDSPNITICLLGGDIHSGANFVETVTSDIELERLIGNLHFDKVFITVDGVDIAGGYTIRYRKQIPLYQRLFDSSGEFYVLLDSGKFGARSLVPAFDIGQIRRVVTTSGIPEEFLDYYHEHGVDVTISGK